MLAKLVLENFTVFKAAEFDFSPGLNVLIGENGAGKSHVLKLCYALQLMAASLAEKKSAKDVTERTFAQTFVEIFMPDYLGRLVSRDKSNKNALINARFANGGFIEIKFSARSSEKADIAFDVPAAPAATALFIPPKEIISVFPGFQATLEKRELPFDATYLHLAKALGTAALKGKKPQSIDRLLKEIADIVNSSVIKKENKFYFHSRESNRNIEAHLVAEGQRKLGMLMHLLQNGELSENSSLFWDEPEANLNPRLLIRLAGILAHLSRIMQVTIATHSLILLRELEILQESNGLEEIRYFGLRFDKDGFVEVSESTSSDDIGDIAALDASLDQAERYMLVPDGGNK